jgi:hypothetical protein
MIYNDNIFFIYVHEKVKSNTVSSPRQLQGVLGNADGGAVWPASGGMHAHYQYSLNFILCSVLLAGLYDDC